jgi:hypothetical protein
MVTKIAEFIGEYNVTTSSEESVLQQGMKLHIGDGKHGATQPVLTDGYFITVGFAVVDQDGAPVLTTGDEGPTSVPLVLIYEDGTLWWKGFFNNAPLRVYLSLAQGATVGGLPFKAIYGTTLVGDPEQVGVWGADGSPSGG